MNNQILHRFSEFSAIFNFLTCFRKFDWRGKYLRNSDKISLNSEQNSMKKFWKRRKDTLLGQQEIQWSGLRLWINSHRRMIRWFETMFRWNELHTRRLFTNARGWLCKQWRWVRRVFCVPRGRRFAIWQFELQAASDVMHQIWQNMQQCLYHYDLNARDTIIEYMQLELSHSSTATRDARARKVSHAVK